MLKKGIFRTPSNELEGSRQTASAAENELTITCPSCKAATPASELSDNLHVCPRCGFHFRMNARQRIDCLTDEGAFEELFDSVIAKDVIAFPDYGKKLRHARLESAEKEGVICGKASIGGHPCALFVMEPYFMMGSMGAAVGERITRLFEYALQNRLPVIGYTVSGGARMQEGIVSLMQMAKTSGAVKRHSDAGLLFVAVLTDPTTGGVTASFAMEGDIILAEPRALIGFAGPRVIEQTIRQKLPAGFQRSEFLLEKGFVDAIVRRPDQKQVLCRILALHERS